MKELLKQIEIYQTLDLPENLFDKLDGETLPNASVEVIWFDREESDNGYIFVLPNQEADEGDVCVHIPSIDNSDGIGKGESIHCHLSNILTNKRVKKVILKGGFR